jgi:hypothetical protein
MNRGLDLSHRFDARKPEDWIFGAALPTDTLQENGSWVMFLPEYEIQHPYSYEVSACASFGSLNCIETLIFQQYGIKENWSDRFLAAASGTTSSGNSPQTVCETIRKVGLVLESAYPYTPDIDTFEKYYGPIPPKLYEVAREFLAKYDFKHEYVTPTKEAILAALKTSPLGMSVYAWNKQGDRYVSLPDADNHWVMLVEANDDHMLIFDTYDDDGSLLKKVAWFTPAIVKRYYVKKKVYTIEKGNWLTDLMARCGRFIADLWTTAFNKIVRGI